MPVLLTRDEFREQVFVRDGLRCVWCGRQGGPDVPMDAHHLIERKLWEDGGYYLDNGVTVCQVAAEGERRSCHLLAEATVISPTELRQRAGITQVLLPDTLTPGNEYTKWGDVQHADGSRDPGPLFGEESVQKILRTSGLLHSYFSGRSSHTA